MTTTRRLRVFECPGLKGDYLDFSHLIELKDINNRYITEIYLKRKLSIIKNHKITNC